jgi:UMP-CMP kinase
MSQYAHLLDDNAAKTWEKKPRIIFILGGPGAGKSTQSRRIQKAFGYVHLSAGDLLRAESATEGSKFGKMIDTMIENGEIVPGEITIGLIIQAIDNTKTDKFIIDGFPRNIENYQVFAEHLAPYSNIINLLHFECPEEIMAQRLLGRSENRLDDNIESINKRFATYKLQTIPIVQEFEKLNKSIRVDSSQPLDAVEETLSAFFSKLKDMQDENDSDEKK